MSDERGLSDVIAFVLTFSVIILSVSAVSLVGVDQLTEARNHEQVNGAERGMVALASTFEDVNRRGAPRRLTALALQDGSVTIADSTLGVRVDSSVGGSYQTRVDVGSLQHRLGRSTDGVTIAYEGGAVARSDAVGLSYAPPLRCAPETGMAVLTVVNLTGATAVGAGSPGFDVGPEDLPADAPVRDAEQSLKVAGDLVSTDVRYSTLNATADRRVTVDFSDMAHRGQWRGYFEQADGWTVTDTYEATCGSGRPLDTVVVRVVTIDVTTAL